jgi:Flp pilus assembly protein TadG
MKQRSLFTPQLATIFRRQEGVSLAEFALILPVFLLILLGMVDMGRGFNTYIGMQNATREGIIWLANTRDRTGMNARINSELSRIGLTSADVNIALDPDQATYAGGDLVTLTIEYPYDLLFGAITDFSTLTIHSEHTMRVLP